MLDFKSGRIQAIDLIKGITLVFMVLFNYSVTLTYFNLIAIPENYFYSFLFPRLIASIFIFFSGVSAYASFKNHKKGFDKRYFIRGFKLLVYAILITFFTYIFIPENMIFFGILHFFAISSFIIPFAIRYNKLNLFFGFLCIAAGSYLQTIEFDFSYLLWLGFVPFYLSSFDYFPLLPWIGVLLSGLYFAEAVINRVSNIKYESSAVNSISFLGKNSLSIYLIHQPVLILILISSGFKFF